MDILNEQRPIINISVFGPPDHGKSTLAGYLFYKYMMSDFDFQKYINQLKIKLGNDYRDDRKYAYISDRHPSEQIGITKQMNDREEKVSKGTSQHVHGLEIDIGDNKFHLFDNPGHWDWRKETIKGLLRGDYGIFVMNIKQLSQ